MPAREILAPPIKRNEYAQTHDCAASLDCVLKQDLFFKFSCKEEIKEGIIPNFTIAPPTVAFTRVVIHSPD